MLKEMWERQKIQQRHWPVVDLSQALLEHIHGLHEEAVEIKKALGLLKQNVRDNQADRRQALIECVDVYKHLLALMICLGIEPEEFAEAFYAKSDLVDVRWLSDITSPHKIIVLDMDDVVADYATGFAAYEAQWLQARRIDNPTHKDHEDAKHDFRMVGGYGLLPTIDGAVNGIQHLRELGYQVGILTARPAHLINTIYTDTLTWLKQHNIVVDFILWERDKCEALSRLKLDRVCVVENSFKHVHDLSKMGLGVVWYNGSESNIHSFEPFMGKVVIVHNWPAVLKAIAQLLPINKQEK